MYPFSPADNRSRPAPRVEQDGEQDGEGFALCLICPIQFDRAVFSNSNSSPSPPRRLFFACGFQLVPRPRAWDVRTNGRSAAAGGTAVCLRLFFVRVALSLGARSLLSRLRFGFSFPGSLCFLGLPSGLVRLRRAPSSLRPRVLLSRAFSTTSLLSASCLIRRVRSARCSCLVARPYLDDSVAVPCHPICVVSCFAPSASAFCVSSSLLCSSRAIVPPCLVVPLHDCRSACFARLGCVRLRGGLALVRSYSVPPFSPPCLS